MTHAVLLWDRTLAGWTAHAAPDARVALAAEAGALRIDFTLGGGASWAIARRAVDLELPSAWALELTVRGDAPRLELQVKLVGPGGDVWWWRRPGFLLSRDAGRVVLRRAALEFAWGPSGGGEPARIVAVEIAVAAAAGTGTLVVEDFRLAPRPAAADPPRPVAAYASSARAGCEAACALDGDAATAWRPEPGDPAPALALDLGTAREWGGLVVCFAGAASPATRLLAGDDGARWAPVADEPGSAATRRWLGAGEIESRWIRLELPASADGVAEVAVAPLELAVAPARWAALRAQAAPRGRYPRHLLGEHAPWAVVGGDGDATKGLLGEDGALEVDAESFTLEPFLLVDGRLVTWADVVARPSLADGTLPMPSVEWTGGPLGLRVTAFASGERGARALVARYLVTNPGGAPANARLVVAVRPFQVLPAWQRLNVAPAVARIARAEADGARLRVNGTREVVAVTAPDAASAVATTDGLDAVLDGGAPASAAVDDPLGFVEGVLAFDLRVLGGGAEEVVVAVPLDARAAAALPSGLDRASAARFGRAREDAAVDAWRARLAAIPLALPPCAEPVMASLRASIGWILVNREGVRIQPGPRCYRRSWIRDGTLTGTALAEMGLADEGRDFLRWYAPHQRPDGTVPCAIDRDGTADPAPEHDAHGQLVWGVVELWRLTGDAAFLAEMWPRVAAAAAVLERLRAERTGRAFEGTACFGLLPESISHEGYSSRPVHAYWDDLFAVRAFADAAAAATVLGQAAEAARFAALADAIRRDLHASVVRTMAAHAIDFVPGSVELGDFDPTSTAIAFDPCAAADALPRAALEWTFARYWDEVTERRAAREARGPYEVRNVVAFLALGWKERALALLDRLLADQRPPAWRQWPEIVWRDPRAPRFLGDLPHGWVASTFVRAVRRLVAWERPDGTLLVGSGVPEAWVREAPGVRARALPTHWGALDLELRADGDDAVRVTLGGTVRPPGGIVVAAPLARPLHAVTVNGVPCAATDSVRVAAVPAEVVFRH